jgi:sulfide:quinone oxidoreductase
MSARVVIAGAGVAGLETLLALRALAGDRAEITLVAPELKFINQSMCVEQPFTPQRVRGIRLGDVASEFHAHWYRDELRRVDHEKRHAITKSGERLPYDRLVLATGARPEHNYADTLTYRDGRDGATYRLLLHRLREGRINKVAFVKPPGASWLLPLYDLVLLTAADCAANNLSDVELTLITPEEAPLAAFGKHASETVRRLLDDHGVTLYTSSYAVPEPPKWLRISPGDHRVAVNRVVTEPRLVGRRIPGIPFDHDTFIPVDAHGRVRDLDDVFAAGSATSFPVKQGGLAAQQADAAAEAIAASVGVDIDPQPFHPVLRGVLLTGGPPRYLRADISGTSGDDSTISKDSLWWPPDRLAGRYLAPYLSRQTGSALDVHMPDGKHAIPVEATLDFGPTFAASLDEGDRPQPLPKKFARRRPPAAARRHSRR